MTDEAPETGIHQPDPAPAPAPGDWREALPNDLRRAAERFHTPADAVKVAADLRRKLSNAVTLPGPNAADSEIAVFRRRLGVPESPEGYRLDDTSGLPGKLAGDAGIARERDDFVAALHKAGATQDVVGAAVGWYYASLGDAHREGQRALDEANELADRELRREWGAGFDRNVELGQRAYQALVPQALRDRFEAIALDADADFKRLFARLGGEIAEEHVLAVGDPAGARSTLEERATVLRARDDYWTSDSVQREMRSLMEQLHGTGPAHPGEG